MFDTSMVRTHSVDGSHRFGVLTVSIALHSFAVVAAISAGIANTEFPSTAPDQMQVFIPLTAPPSPPPPPLGRPAPAKAEPAATTPAKVATAPVAPTVLRDAIPTAIEPATGSSTAVPGTGDTGPIGDPNGVLGGIPGGTPGGTATIAQPVADVTYHPGGEVIPARVLHRVEPRYPQIMIAGKVPATVTVRCVIDRNGQIRDAEIVKSSHPPFNAAVLDAIRQWTFAPGSMRGSAVDTYFELTVKFSVR